VTWCDVLTRECWSLSSSSSNGVMTLNRTLTRETMSQCPVSSSSSSNGVLTLNRTLTRETMLQCPVWSSSSSNGVMTLNRTLSRETMSQSVSSRSQSASVFKAKSSNSRRIFFTDLWSNNSCLTVHWRIGGPKCMVRQTSWLGPMLHGPLLRLRWLENSSL